MPIPSARCLLALGLIAGLGLSVVPAQARRSATSDPAPAADTVKEPEKAWTTGTVPADCTRSRRKLFQPGEGWVVRSVTTCR
ncbi:MULTISPECIES: hypothetical protein [Methylobacterium]|uniref:Uncharacterized protein n=1 Tax=Methylobacterium jeotgali TaxID=381630 RepID=A0ABQ4T1W6_9HYPH|nr:MULTISPECIES: hypothetical protein [Methylobacterium]GBU19478.1 hypothetical protein AwMethylo_36930 [Methylobacterium sp.]GJE08785.1 hypothetical protein AOPFMNJM_4131 [Methylobacterium jeotgali]